MDLESFRREYLSGGLSRKDLQDDPFDQFSLWMEQALGLGIIDPTAMTISTVALNGQPSQRIVLLKSFDAQGFVFYTNYESRKARELESNPQAAANFLWMPLQRQVNVIGRVERIPQAESLKYFLSRPLGSQLGAWTSPQSEVISSRSILEAKLDQLKRRFADGKVPLPDNWGGYRIVPESFEFWQGRPNRLHDRFIYRLSVEGQWTTERLAP